MLSKFLDPKNDFAFRRIFGSEKNKDILIHLLNDMLVFREGKPIEEVTFLKTIQDPETAAKKTSVVDVLCKDAQGHTYIVEMQVAKGKGFEKRAQYYAAKAYSSQMEVGGKYHILKEVIFLAITDFVMFPDKKPYKSDHVILDKESYAHDLKDFSFTFLELPKFTKSIEQLTSMTERWAYFFKHAAHTSEEDLDKIIGHESSLERAYQELNRFGWNEEELRTYEQEEKRVRDNEAVLEQKYEEALEKGLMQGIEKGLAQGIEKGLAEGAKVEKVAIARKMLSKGTAHEAIAEITGLSLEEIKAL